MPRVRVNKTDRKVKKYDISQYEKAYDAVKAGEKSLRKAGDKFGVNFVSLMRYIKKRDKCGEKEDKEEDKEENKVSMGFIAHNRVFKDSQEKEISKYLMRCADINCALSAVEVRKLAYELTAKYDLPRPAMWTEKKMAGIEWFQAFVKRNKELSAKNGATPYRVISWNKISVEGFYNNLQAELNRHTFEPEDIYTVDEMSVTTGLKSDSLVGGKRRVTALNSSEKESVVTVTLAANAVGTAIPPMFVFPREHYEKKFLRDGPEGSSGAANTSGWMQQDIFLKFLKHFQENVEASPTHKVLIVLDNHFSHVHIDALDYCNENGIILLSFPLHWSHKLQPLKKYVYGALKEAINSTCSSWMKDHPGKSISLYDTPRIISIAMPLALTKTNIKKGFRKTGIYPMNRKLFTSDELISDVKCNNLLFNKCPVREEKCDGNDDE